MPSSPEPVHYVEDKSGLERAVDVLRDAAEIAVDTESDSMHCYFEKVCFIQLKAEGQIWIIDTIRLRELDPLVEIFNDPSSLKILHGADYDVLCLARDFGVRFGRLYDTMIAAQYLGRSSLGLAALCEEHFGVVMDKSLTRHNWAIRPLAEKYLEYMAADVRHLSELRGILDEQIDEADLRPELENEFDRLRQVPYVEKPFDPEGYRKIKGASALDRVGKAILKSLFLCRDELARQRDLPPFKVMNNQTKIQLAKKRPTRMDQLVADASRSRFLKRYGDAVMGAIQRALAGEVRVEPAPRRRRDGEGAARFAVGEALRKWRQEKSQETGHPSTVVLPKHVMTAIAESLPETRDELARIPFFGERRFERHADELLELVDEQRG